MTEEARNDLAPHGGLRAGINEGNQVLVSARSADGGPDGLAPALAAELAGRLDVPLQPVPYLAHAGSGVTSLAQADQPGRTIVATRPARTRSGSKPIWPTPRWCSPAARPNPASCSPLTRTTCRPGSFRH